MKFKQSLEEFLASKTNWTGLTMIGSAVVGYLTHAVDAVTAFSGMMGGFALISVKDAIVGASKAT